MKLPEKIKSRHQIRDAAICNDWAVDSLSTSELAEKYKLTERRIYQILTENHSFIVIDKEWEKKKRIHLRNCWIKNRVQNGERSKKDLDDLLNANRIEIEGDKPLVDNSKHIHMTSIKQFIEGIATSNRLPKDSLVDNNSR